MTGRRCSAVGEVIDELKSNPPPVPVDDITEAIQFLQWLAGDNFTLLGVRDYAFTGRARSRAAHDSGLGLLRGSEVPVLKRGGEVVAITPEIWRSSTSRSR